REQRSRAIERARGVRPVRRADEALVSEDDFLPPDAHEEITRTPAAAELEVALMELDHVGIGRRGIPFRSEHPAVLHLRDDSNSVRRFGANAEPGAKVGVEIGRERTARPVSLRTRPD